MPSPKETGILPISLGGSVVRPTRHFNYPKIDEFAHFCKEHLQDYQSIIVIVGGGGEARNAIIKAKKMSNLKISKRELDMRGIEITNRNVQKLIENLEQFKLPVWGKISPQSLEDSSINQPSFHGIFLLGGDKPGHTTDYVAVKIAIRYDVDSVINISNVPGLLDNIEYPTSVIPSITWDEYLKKFDNPKHEPGINIPFDGPAARLAKDHKITVTLLGHDFSNLSNFLAGKDFIGTTVHP